MRLTTALTFDDVLLLPGYSTVRPHQGDISTNLNGLKLKTPILSAAMDTVTEVKMAVDLGNLGGLGVIHRNQSIELQAGMVSEAKKNTSGYVGAAIGVGKEDIEERAQKLLSAGVDVIIVDVACADSDIAIEATEYLKTKYKLSDSALIVGNVATYKAAERLYKAGARIIKSGIGAGSICSTRIVSGVGVPQLSAIIGINHLRKEQGLDFSIIADGGIRNSGDIVKAIAAGADAIMLGRILAGTDSSPTTLSGDGHRIYRGMGSKDAMDAGGGYRYSKEGSVRAPEGVSAVIGNVGNLKHIVDMQMAGLKSGMAYVGASNLKELQELAEFIQITNAGLTESHPHSLDKIIG